jgi:hypothetical protein
MTDFSDELREKELEYLKFKDFWPIFESSLSAQDKLNPVGAFGLILDKEVPLRYWVAGSIYDGLFASKIRVLHALKRGFLMDRLLQPDAYELNNFYKLINFPVVDASIWARPLGELLLMRGDLSRAYEEKGRNQYPWAKEPGGITGWVWYPVNKKIATDSGLEVETLEEAGADNSALKPRNKQRDNDALPIKILIY